MTVRGRSRRGFTLIELLVTAVVAIIMLGAAMALFTRTVTEQHEQRRMAEMKRSAALVMGQLTTELRQAGLGRPRAGRLDTTNVGDVFPGSILVADNHRIGFIADLPRPDSTFNGYSQLATDQKTAGKGGKLPDQGLALINELNGNCDVMLVSSKCKTDVSSQLFDYPTTSSTHNCGENLDGSRTCPWSLNRYRTGEYVIVADGVGRWAERQISDTSVYGKTTDRAALQLKSDVPTGLFADGANQGWVSTPDRVFYRFDDASKRWQRKQCWGTVGTGSPLALSTECPDSTPSNPAVGTNWESLAHVGNFTMKPTFTYWKANGTTPMTTPVLTAADLRSIHRVDIRLEFRRPRYPNTGDATEIIHVARGSITLRQ